MPEWLPRSIFGAILTVVYLALAITAVYSDRHSKAGGWITLSGMASYLLTMPVSMPMEQLGHRPNYKRNLDMALAIGVCAVLVYVAGAMIGAAAVLAVRLLR